MEWGKKINLKKKGELSKKTQPKNEKFWKIKLPF